MSTPTVAAARGNPATKSPGGKSSEIIAWFTAIERDCRGAARALDEQAITLAIGVRKSSKLPGGVDKMMAARRIRKHIQRMARAAEYEAQAARAARNEWISIFGEPGSRANIRKQGIDFTK